MPETGPFGYVSMLNANPRSATLQRPARSLRFGIVAWGSVGLPRAAYQPQRIRNSPTSDLGSSATSVPNATALRRAGMLASIARLGMRPAASTARARDTPRVKLTTHETPVRMRTMLHEGGSG